ncbi:uncharacterized protein L201_002746 [Kwoniella dendrophila CBS 6074]|uniref:Rab proteins geranylgeranyltransferase n=1 Tax=Kwoniella dendrophila CBS 6074 TaxID=1295534 RepID=A0AAX4JSX3_9TREE
MSNPELESDHYDVIVIGTGLSESIAAASLAKSGKSVLHLDPNEYYGGEQASLTLDELINWSNQHASSSSSNSSKYHIRYSSSSTTSLTEELEFNKRRYSLSLFPSILPSRGQLIDTLISSDVSKYVSFRILDSISLYTSTQTEKEESGKFRKVPGSKEEIFKDKSISLIDKRKLMKFLLFTAGEFEQDDLLKGKENQPLIQFLQETFSLSSSLSESIIYAISHCTSPQENTLSALQRTRRYLKSIGRYGNNAFLVGQYGGAGEISQGFCRACAVFGGTYVLGPSASLTSIETTSEGVSIKLPCHPRPVTASHLISSPNHLPSVLIQRNSSSYTNSNQEEQFITAHCVAITKTLPAALRRNTLDPDLKDDNEEIENDDTAVVVFPREGDNVVRCYVNGEGTGSCPPGQYIIYLSTALSKEPSNAKSTSPSEMLKPYLDKITSDSIFESYYISTRLSLTSDIPESSDSIIILKPYAGDELLTEGLDWEAKQGEEAYYKVIGKDGKQFFEKDATEEEELGIDQDDL